MNFDWNLYWMATIGISLICLIFLKIVKRK